MRAINGLDERERGKKRGGEGYEGLEPGDGETSDVTNGREKK